MTTTEAERIEKERIEKERPEALAWVRAHRDVIEADRALSSALRSAEMARLRFDDAITAERKAWDALLASRSLLVENATAP